MTNKSQSQLMDEECKDDLYIMNRETECCFKVIKNYKNYSLRGLGFNSNTISIIDNKSGSVIWTGCKNDYYICIYDGGENG